MYPESWSLRVVESYVNLLHLQSFVIYVCQLPEMYAIDTVSKGFKQSTLSTAVFSTMNNLYISHTARNIHGNWLDLLGMNSQHFSSTITIRFVDHQATIQPATHTYMHVHTYTHVHIHTHTHTHTHTTMRLHIHAYMHTHTRIYLPIIQSTVDYASSAYIHSLNTTPYNKLLSVSKISMKKSFGLSRFTLTDLVLEGHNLYSLEQRINQKLYVLVYHCQTSLLASPLLQQLFATCSAGLHTSSCTRGQASAALVLPHGSSCYGYHSVSFLAADRWNYLPPSCRQARSPSEFAPLTKKHLGYPVKRHCLWGSPLVK